MHCIDILDIVCLYSFKSIVTVTVIMHALLFHSHFLVISIHFFSDGIENFNKTIHFKSFFLYLTIPSVTMFWTFLLPYFAVCGICPRKVSSDTIGLDNCITDLIVDSIKINVKSVYFLMFLLGNSTNDMNGLVWVNLDVGVFISRLTLDSDRQLEYWYNNIYCIVVSIYIVMRCALNVLVVNWLSLKCK